MLSGDKHPTRLTMSQNMMSVSSLNVKIKSLLEATFMHITVEGEVSSITYHTSGHLYFSIKDRDSSIKCVMWRSSVVKMKFRIERGMHIVVEGSVGVYTPRGEYQFYVVKVEPYGKGALAIAFEQLKKRLKEKGYFNTHIKKQIPKNIKKIALVTAKDSAALHDMLKIIEKRWALVDVVVVDTLVQGDAAAIQIAKSLKYADTLEADIVIVGRGGGSNEDLWAFNEEIVADAIFNMRTAVVSAVGHEVDILISDFVADLRAPTPSAAIEMILPDVSEVLYMLDELMQRYKHYMENKLLQNIESLKHMEEMILQCSPIRKLTESQRRFTYLEDEFKRVIDYKIEHFTTELPKIQNNFKQNINFILEKKEQEIEYFSKRIELNNPKLNVKKGWVQVLLKGKIVNLEELKIDDKFTLESTTLKIEAVVQDKKLYE